MHYLDRYWEERDEEDFGRAVWLFKRIREYRDRDHYLDLPISRLALAYYTRGGLGDRQAAVNELRSLEKARPFVPSLSRPSFGWAA